MPKEEELLPAEPPSWFSSVTLSPLQNNIATCLGMLLYFKLVVEFLCWRTIRVQKDRGNNIHRGLIRNLWHLFLSALVMFWKFFDESEWSWKLNFTIPAALMARIFYKGFIEKNPNDPEVQILSLSSSPSDLLFGPLQSAGVFFYLGVYQFRTVEAAIIAAACLGDALAPIVGNRYGRHVYQMPLANPKTLEGSIVVFLGTVTASYFYMYMMQLPLEPLRMVLPYGVIAAVAESTAPSHLDNIVLPVLLHFCIPRIQTLLADDAFGVQAVVNDSMQVVVHRPNIFVQVTNFVFYNHRNKTIPSP
jgi:CDP-diglyceride synthetase